MANRIFAGMQEGLSEPAWLTKVEPFIQKVMARLTFDGEEISVMFCTDEKIRELNKTYRNIDSATDVLSFENDGVYVDDEGEWQTVGDIAISLDTLPVNAAYFKTDNNTELKRLLIHGILHLNGMDHGDEHLEEGRAPECEMLLLQEKILSECNDDVIWHG
ncbi:MAG: rRNA maturation RNase YbeY [Treponema sp.]